MTKPCGPTLICKSCRISGGIFHGIATLVLLVGAFLLSTQPHALTNGGAILAVICAGCAGLHGVMFRDVIRGYLCRDADAPSNK